MAKNITATEAQRRPDTLFKLALNILAVVGMLALARRIHQRSAAYSYRGPKTASIGGG
jgi:hypothetical protein